MCAYTYTPPDCFTKYSQHRSSFIFIGRQWLQFLNSRWGSTSCNFHTLFPLHFQEGQRTSRNNLKPSQDLLQTSAPALKIQHWGFKIQVTSVNLAWTSQCENPGQPCERWPTLHRLQSVMYLGQVVSNGGTYILVRTSQRGGLGCAELTVLQTQEQATWSAEAQHQPPDSLCECWPTLPRLWSVKDLRQVVSDGSTYVQARRSQQGHSGCAELAVFETEEQAILSPAAQRQTLAGCLLLNHCNGSSSWDWLDASQIPLLTESLPCSLPAAALSPLSAGGQRSFHPTSAPLRCHPWSLQKQHPLQTHHCLSWKSTCTHTNMNTLSTTNQTKQKSETEPGPEHSCSQHARELITAWKTSHKHNNKDLSRLWQLSPGMHVNTRDMNSTRGTS